VWAEDVRGYRVRGLMSVGVFASRISRCRLGMIGTWLEGACWRGGDSACLRRCAGSQFRVLWGYCYAVPSVLWPLLVAASVSTNAKDAVHNNAET
jgi:hypothetical protein